MQKDRGELEKRLIKFIINNISNKNALSSNQKWYLELYEKYNIPISLSSDIISQRKDISEYNEFILYAITDVVNPKLVKEYFTQQEIKLYTGKKYEIDEIKFPLKFHLIKITDEQYIGKTTAQFLMQLREKQLINYNAETQRALRIMLKGGTKILRPYIDNKAVNEIDNCYAEGIFIPNMITLNINLDDEKADWVYDEKEEILKVSDITAFDIVDGYHRYLGMSRNYDRDNTWDYPMMLQVSAFSVGRAKQLIFQENHKTKMKEVDSSTYDQYDAGNIVVKRLNTDTDSYLNGKIDLGNGLVNPGILAKAIDRLYFPKKPERKEIITTSKDLQNKLNKFIEDNDSYIERTWKVYETLIIIYGIYNNQMGKIPNVIQNISQEDIDTLNRIKDVNNKVSNILKEVYENA